MRKLFFPQLFIPIFIFIALLPLMLNAGAANYKFQNINELYGISMRQASSVCKDHNGFVWASTKSGIIRLTGDDYRIYQLPFESSNVLTVKLVYTHATLWAYSNNGQMFRYNPISDAFVLYYNLGKELNNRHLNVTSVLFQGSDTCWMATSEGLFMYQNKQHEAQRHVSVPLTQLEWYNSDSFFAVSLNEISVFNVNNKENKVIFNDLMHYYYQTYSLFFDEDNEYLWLGSSSKGLFYFDLSLDTLIRFAPGDFPTQPVMDIESLDNQRIMVGVDGRGIWTIKPENLSIEQVYKSDVNNPHSLSGNGVYDIYHDTEANRVWVCTYSGGLSFFDLGSPVIEHIVHQVNQSNSLGNNNVNSVLEDSNKKLWFATDNGISVWKTDEDKWVHLYNDKQEQAQVFLTLCEDRQGNIWAGSYSSGVYVLDGASGKELAHYSQATSESPFINDFVFHIYEDSNDEIWIGGINGEVVRYIPEKNHFQKYFFQPATKIVQYNDSLMLLACSYGLVQLNKNNSVYTLLVDDYIITDISIHAKKIWLGTGGDGLLCYSPSSGQIQQFTTANGLLSNHVNSIVYADGYFWLGTEIGLCRFCPIHETVLVYSNYHLLSSLSFNNNAHFALSDGRLAFGTNNGVLVFDPASMSEEELSGSIYYQDISVLGRSIRDNASFNPAGPVNELEKLSLKYRQNTITLDLLPVGDVSKAKFSWKLEGLDPDWTEPSNHRLISYNNIPYKDYDLKIRMFDSSLSRIIDQRTLSLIITPPFWATWWFLSLMIILSSFFIYSIFWYSLNRIKQQHAEEKVRFFTNTAHEIRTSLTLIKAPVEELRNELGLSEKARHFLNMAIEQGKHLNAVVSQLMDFQKADIGKEHLNPVMANIPDIIKHRTEMFESLAAVKSIKLFSKFNTENYETAVDVIHIEKVIDNLISNAIKYSKAHTHVYISFAGNDKQWNITVTDKGIGISKQDQKRLFNEFYRAENAINSKIVGSGVGLLLVKNIVKLHSGQISFTSEEGRGSEFTVSIPYKKLKNTIEKSEAETSTEDFNKESLNTSFEKAKPESKKLKLLIVEDNDELRRFLTMAFENVYDILAAPNGVEAWELIQSVMPDLVISDIMMPKMGGFELCKRVKSTFETSHIPIVLLTALDEDVMQLHGLGLGADDYLTKPFDTELLRQKIRTIIQNRFAIRERALRLIQTEKKGSVLSNALNDEFLKRTLEVMKGNMANQNFGKDEFASEMKVSGSLLYKKVKALTGLSPSDFIKSARMDYALELLQKGKYSIYEISDKCGFASSGYFSTVFKKYFGKSPSEV